MNLKIGQAGDERVPKADGLTGLTRGVGGVSVAMMVCIGRGQLYSGVRIRGTRRNVMLATPDAWLSVGNENKKKRGVVY